ncbi:MAG: GNAT family N-acetyltransferase [Dehalococcoidia bacterium]
MGRFKSASLIEFLPLTPGRWRDLELLFGERGGVGGCWCMYWRLTHSEFEAKKGEANRKAMKGIVDSGEIPGIIAYVDRQPAGWCSLAPREAFPRLENSRVAKRVDDQPVWSVVCFFIAKPFRRQGLSVALLKAGIEHAREQGARIVEGYPVDPRKGSMPDPFAWTGIADGFVKAEFVEVARRSDSRPVMRYFIDPSMGG